MVPMHLALGHSGGRCWFHERSTGIGRPELAALCALSLKSASLRAEKRCLVEHSAVLWPDGCWGSHPGAEFVIVVFQENWCALFCICLALVFDVTHLDEKVDITVTSVGFTRAQ